MPVSLYQTVKQFGLAWTLKRSWVEFCIRSGPYRAQFPCRAWRPDEYRHWLAAGSFGDAEELWQQWRAKGPRHFVPDCQEESFPGVLAEVAGTEGLVSLRAEAEAIRNGRFRYFFKQEGMLGFPPDWGVNPFSGGHAPPQIHWSRIPLHSSRFGDIKYIWEPGRFASAYTLARAYRATGDRAYAECFWQLVESWGNANPPNHGPHWRCGQEISIRLMAWSFALHVFKDSPATTPERFSRLLGMVAAQADRVSRTTLYAHLQDNNHSISEGAGLWTVGILFPTLAGADTWRKQGQEILESEAERLIHGDGSFSQKSNHYHRLMLHDYLYALRIGEVNGYRLAHKAVERIRKAADFLLAMTDPVSGWAPNIGGNDGALILPLNGCDYNDMRPVTAAAHYLFTREKIFKKGPWHEDLYWLFGPEALKAPASQAQIPELAAAEGGYYTLRGRESWGMFRCGPYLERPAHADSLHLDIWWRGRNIAIDPGSFLYYSDPPWNNGLQSTRLHNTVSVDGLDQLEKGPRFMWLRWHDAKLLRQGKSHHLSCLEGEHDGYTRLEDPLRHRRSVLFLSDTAWIVIDDLFGQGRHEFMLQWLLARAEKKNDGIFHQLLYPEGPLWFFSCLMEPHDSGQGTADWLEEPSESNPRGWLSRYYGVRQPAFSFTLNVQCKAPVRFLSIFSFTPLNDVTVLPLEVVVHEKQQKLAIKLGPLGNDTGILREARVISSSGEEILNLC